MFVRRLLCGLGLVGGVATVALSSACGGYKWGNFSNVRDERMCEVNVSLPTMACSEACPMKVRAALLNVQGVQRVSVDYEHRSAAVDAAYPACSAAGYESMIKALYYQGYSASIVSSRPLAGWETP